MITVYLPLDQKGEDGKFYKEFEVPEGVPMGDNIVYVGPAEDLLFPRYDYTQGIWVEDKDSIISALKTENAELTSRVDMTEGALLDLADMILSR
jgi:hypothetical protein